MQEALRDLLERRKNRAIAVVLGVKERDCDPDLNAMSSQKLRKVILDQFNDFHGIVVDVMESLDSGNVILNEKYLEKLELLYTGIADIKRQLETDSSSARLVG